jgi:hypothetical protein
MKLFFLVLLILPTISFADVPVPPKPEAVRLHCESGDVRFDLTADPYLDDKCLSYTGPECLNDPQRYRWVLAGETVTRYDSENKVIGIIKYSDKPHNEWLQEGLSFSANYPGHYYLKVPFDDHNDWTGRENDCFLRREATSNFWADILVDDLANSKISISKKGALNPQVVVVGKFCMINCLGVPPLRYALNEKYCKPKRDSYMGEPELIERKLVCRPL